MTIKRNILLNPGPATTTDTVKMAQVVPDICPREQEFGALMRSITEDLTGLAGGDGEYVTVLFGGSGSAAMDAVINSVTPPEKKILLINNGAYGERMVKIANAYRIECVEVQFSWDALPNLDEIEAALQRDPDIAVVGMVHHETTTGLLNPIEEIGSLAKQYEKVFVVDTISSFAGVPFNIKDCHIDFMMSTSNKCLQGMAGICFAICKNSEADHVSLSGG
jgi:aspartate aminotransferase-like enzyme